MTYDVIGDDVMVKSNRSNKIARAVIYGSEVSWSEVYKIRICSQFITAKSCHFLVNISKIPKNPSSKGAHDSAPYIATISSNLFYMSLGLAGKIKARRNEDLKPSTVVIDEIEDRNQTKNYKWVIIFNFKQFS